MPDHVSYIDLASRVSLPLPPLPIADMAPPAELARLRVPLAEARVMLVASAGVHFKSDPPFAHTNDLTFRRIAQATSAKSIRPPTRAPSAGLGWRTSTSCSRISASLSLRKRASSAGQRRAT